MRASFRHKGSISANTSPRAGGSHSRNRTLADFGGNGTKGQRPVGLVRSGWRVPHPSHAAELVLLGTSFLPAPSVTFAMTADAKRNQVVYQIAAEPAPRFHVMDLHAFHGTALLTPPTISLQDPDSEFRVLFRAKFEPRL